jgi:predicted GNAT superfamily acetyltransferase
MAVRIRDLHGIDDYRAVVELERAIWAYTDWTDVITVPVFIITLKRGGILVGAFDEHDRMIGFAFSIVGIKDGKPTQWSHMMGVLQEHRQGGLGRLLKLAQRDRALAAGYDLMEWTFDPLQAANAHLNFTKLGVVCDEYVENVYGESTSALHRGTPTDRFVVEWWMREPHVERRIAADRQSAVTVRSTDAAQAPMANETALVGDWRTPASSALSLDTPRLWVEVPPGFTEMQQQAPDLARDWRFHTRAIFEAYFGRGYRAVDFELDRERGGGRYLLAMKSS